MKNNFLINNMIAHRGIHDNEKIYENTLESFKLAIKKKYIIELDIHLTKDNKLIVFHDYNAKRMLNIDKIVEEMTYKEINNQNILHVPTIEEVLSLVKGQVPLLIEIKQKSKVGKLEQELMNILKTYNGKYAIQSFNIMTIYWFKKNYPNVLRGQLSYKFKNQKMNPLLRFILKNMIFNIITKPNFISYKYNELSKKKIEKYKKKGIITLAWTISNQKDFKQYKKEYDNLICEKIL